MSSVGWLLTRFSKPKGKDRYVTVTTFSQADSNTISSALQNGSNKVYFGDDEGVINIDGNTNFKNGLLGISEASSSTILPANIVNTSSVDDKYIFSKPNGNWIIYCQNKDNLFLLQNPVPRPEWDTCYKNASNVTVQQTIQSCLKTDGQDPVCKYLDGDNETPDDNFCMNDLLTPATRKVMKKGDPLGYAKILQFCDCSKRGYNDFPFIKTSRKQTECPNSLVFSVCNTSIDAGRDLKAGNVNIEQKCGANQTNVPSSIGGTPSPPPSSTSPPPTNDSYPPQTTPPTNDSSPPSTNDYAIPSSNFSLSTLTMTQKLIIGGVILLVVILILVLALSDDDKPPTSYGPPMGYHPPQMQYPQPMGYPTQPMGYPTQPMGYPQMR